MRQIGLWADVSHNNEDTSLKKMLLNCERMKWNQINFPAAKPLIQEKKQT